MDLVSSVSKYKNSLLNLIVIILAFYISFNIFKHQTKEVELLQDKKDLELKKNTVLVDINRLEKEVESYKELLPKKDANEIISIITAIANDSGVKIVSIRPGPEESTSDYIKIPFNLVINTLNYDALGKFVSNLENYQYVFQVENIDIRSGNIQQESGLSANLTVSNIAYQGQR